MESLKSALSKVLIEKRLPDFVRVIHEQKVPIGTPDYQIAIDLISAGVFEPIPRIEGKILYFKLTETGEYFKENSNVIPIPPWVPYFNSDRV